MNLDKNNIQNKKDTKSKTLSEFFGGPFFVLPRHLIERRLDLTKASSFKIQDFFFAYFSSESGQRMGYKHFFTQQLAKELRMDRKTFREGLKEIEEAGILKIYDFEHKGKICFFENEFNKDLIKRLDSKQLFINIDMKLNISISDKKIEEKIINFPLNEVGKLPPSSGETTPIKWGNYPHQVGKLPPSSGETTPTLTNAETFDWSNWETALKKPQEYYIKEYIKESYHKEEGFTEGSNEDENYKENDDEMNDDLYKNLVRKEEEINKKIDNSDEKIYNHYLSSLVELGLYKHTAQRYLKLLSFDDIQDALNTLFQELENGVNIQNTGNFVRENLELKINPNYQRKFTIQEGSREIKDLKEVAFKEENTLPIPAKVSLIDSNKSKDSLDKKTYDILQVFYPHLNEIQLKSGFSLNLNHRIDEVARLFISKFNYVSNKKEDHEITLENMKKVKTQYSKEVKDIIDMVYKDQALNYSLDSRKILDLFFEWFEVI